MKSPLISAALLVTFALPAISATVNTGPIETSFAVVSIPPRVASVNKSTTITVDLSSLSGLTPGSDIDITFTTANDLLWLGEFNAEDGELTLNFHGRFTLAAGAFETFQDVTWSLGPVDFVNNSPSVAGYSLGPVPSSFSLTVPWGTNLSAINLTLTDQFSLTGNDPFVLVSDLKLNSAVLTTSSVPEPATWVVSMSACGLLLTRRRKLQATAAPR